MTCPVEVEDSLKSFPVPGINTRITIGQLIEHWMTEFYHYLLNTTINILFEIVFLLDK